jgi:ADP-heptose:LPS heptosyltransferase
LLKANFIKLLDPLLGKLLVWFLPRNRVITGQFIDKILIIRPGGIGDAVLLLPAIKTLNEHLPGVKIEVLAECRNAEVFCWCPQVSKTRKYDRICELMSVIRDTYDVVIDTEQSHYLSAVIARLVLAPIKSGFATNERRKMFTHGIDYDMDAYEPDNFASLLKPLGVECKSDVNSFNLLLPPLSVSNANKLLKPLSSDSYVVIFPGASIQEKRWGSGRFRRVCEVLSALGIKTVVVGAKEDRQQGEVITAGGFGLNLTGLTTLSETAAVIKKSSLLLSGDSGVLHIAVGLGVPTVSLFGPGRAKKWAPQGGRHIVINKGFSCSPCTIFGKTHSCLINVQCMREITVDEVVNSIMELLTRVGAMPNYYCERDWVETA